MSEASKKKKAPVPGSPADASASLLGKGQDFDDVFARGEGTLSSVPGENGSHQISLILTEMVEVKRQLRQIIQTQDVMQDVLMNSDKVQRRASDKQPQASPARMKGRISRNSTADYAEISVDDDTKDPVAEVSPTKTTESVALITKSGELPPVTSKGTDPLHKKDELADTLSRAEFLATEEEKINSVKRKGYFAYAAYSWNSLTKERMEIMFESIMGFIISLNAIYIGLAMDMETKDEAIWLVVNIAFSVIFVTELAIKLHSQGPKKYFLSFSNQFDTTLVAIDLFQLVLELANPNVRDNSNVPSASLFRIIRLAKLTRLIRLLRAEVFKDLLAMIQGMISGMSTLVWAMILFLIAMYVMALLFREMLGNREAENVKEYFDAVPRSIFTTFRCAFGDCAARGGVPIFEFVYDNHGALHVGVYCVFVFVTVIGLFNVISAIFVETTMAAAMSLVNERKVGRLRDVDLWATSVASLIRRVVEMSSNETVPDSLTEDMQLVKRLEVPRSLVDTLVRDEDVQEILENLDIDPGDNEYLSDILDPDNGGTITIMDFVDGLRRLRGDPRRSDIISIDLMIRSMQIRVDEILARMKSSDRIQLKPVLTE